jgi:predicted small lipoprotein YifL
VRPRLSLVALAFVLAACGGSGPPDLTFPPSTVAPPVSAEATSSTDVSGSSSVGQPSVGSVPLAAATLVLTATSIGPALLGGDPDTVEAVLSGVLGTPSAVTDWGSDVSFGECPGKTFRSVRWGDLVVLFGDGADNFAAQGRRHAFAWRLGPASALGAVDAALTNGVRLGSSRDEVVGAFGGDPALIVADEVLGPSFVVGSGPALVGALSGIGPDAVVVYLEGGVQCGP